MNQTYTIKNFRVFDEQGATFEMAPVTILTGCNSSGKSSVTKSLMLVHNLFENILNDYANGKRCYLEDYRLKLNHGKHNLGTFASIVNNKSLEKSFSIEYAVKSFSYVYVVCVTFSQDNYASAGNGRIANITIKDESGAQIFLLDLNSGVAECNIAQLKDSFFSFMNTISLLDQYENNTSYVNDLELAKKIQELQLDDYFKKFKTHANGQNYNFLHDHLSSLISLCSSIKGTEYKSLFYIDALQWLNGCEKESVRTRIKEHVKESMLNVCYDKEQKSPICEKIDLIVEEFYNSGFQSFMEFYLYYENKFLKRIKMEFMSDNLEERGTFISKIERSLAYQQEGVNSMMNYIKDAFLTYDNDIETFWNNEDFRFVFILHYLRLITSFADYNNMQKVEGDTTPIFDGMILFMCNTLYDVLINTPSFLNRIDFIDARRANVQRLYNFQDESSFNGVVQNYLSRQNVIPQRTLFEVYNLAITQPQEFKVIGKNADGSPIFDKPLIPGISKYSLHIDKDYSERYEQGTFLKTWLRRFEIAEDIDFDLSAEGSGVSVKLTGKNGVQRNLADYGFGVTQLTAILLQIETNIDNAQFEDGYVQLENSNVIKIKYGYRPSYIAVEEPESHLHPKFQSLLADMFYDAYQKYNISFIIETHSEYLVRKTQVLVAKKAKEDGWNAQDLAEKCPFKVYYMPKPEDGKPYDMHYQTNGTFVEQFGEGFYDEASTLSFQVLIADSE